jgi:hypothetical protein
VLFLVYAGKMRWRTKAGDELEAHLGQDNTKDVTAQAWRTALDPEGDWIPRCCSADRRLSEVRQDVPDAGGLVIATDQTARAYAAILREITGEAPTVVLSDDKAASGRIETFGTRRPAGWWPCAWCRKASTCRASRSASTRRARRRRCSSRRRSAASCGPAPGRVGIRLPPERAGAAGLAGEMERERDHALDREGGDDDGLEDTLLAEAEREDKASDDLEQEFSYQALGSVAHFDRVLFDGKEFGQLAVPGTPEEEEFLGFRACSNPSTCTNCSCSASRVRAGTAPARRRRAAVTEAPDASRTRCRRRCTARCANSVSCSTASSALRARAESRTEPCTRAPPDLRGPEVARATVAQLQARIEVLRSRVLLIAPRRAALARMPREYAFTSHWLVPVSGEECWRLCERP